MQQNCLTQSKAIRALCTSVETSQQQLSYACTQFQYTTVIHWTTQWGRAGPKALFLLKTLQVSPPGKTDLWPPRDNIRQLVVVFTLPQMIHFPQKIIKLGRYNAQPYKMRRHKITGWLGRVSRYIMRLLLKLPAPPLQCWHRLESQPPCLDLTQGLTFKCVFGAGTCLTAARDILPSFQQWTTPEKLILLSFHFHKPTWSLRKGNWSVIPKDSQVTKLAWLMIL